VRILQLSDLYPPVLGGLERHVRVLSHELALRGHDVSVATMRTPGSLPVEDDGPVRVHRLSGMSRLIGRLYEDEARPFHPPVPDPAVVLALRRLVSKLQPDVVHAHGWILYSALPAAQASGTKVVVTLHDHGLQCPKKTLFRKGRTCEGPAARRCLPCASRHYGALKGVPVTLGMFGSRALNRRVDRYLAISRFVGEAARPFTGVGGPLEVLPTFLDDSLFDLPADDTSPDFVPDRAFVMFAGALGAHKGVDVLLEAHARLSPRAPLLLLGTRAQDLPRALPLDVTAIAGAPSQQVMAAWRRCAVAVVPSRWPEPLGQVALEAMAAGRPVVASAVGGLLDLISHEETGLLVPPGDSAALAEAISRLLEDGALRSRLGEAARTRADRYRVSVVTDRLEEIFAEVVAGGRARAFHASDAEAVNV
jgi:glycosyltransferase involved in cell wall biosynthesis